jgi:hypothetical protein
MKKILLLCIAVLAGISMMAQNSVALKMNLEKNKVYRLMTSSEQTIIQTVNNNQQTVETKAVYAVSIKMMDATPGFMITEVRFDTLKTNTNTMGKTILINSANEGNIKSTETADVMSYIMNRLCKNALYVKMDYSGKPLEIVNSKMLSDIILKDTSAIILTEPTASAVKKQVANVVSESSLKTMIEMFTNHLPAKEVSVGDSWNITAKTNSGGMALDIITTYHMDGLNGNVASITAEAEIKAAENADPMVSGGATITFDNLKGLSKSSITMDTGTGLIIEDKAKTHIAGNLGASGPGFSLQIPMDISGVSKSVMIP